MLAVAAVAFRLHAVWIFLAMLAAASTKEIAPVTLGLLAGALFIGFVGEGNWRSVVRPALATASALAIGVVMNSLFNWFRYGVFHNAVYIDQVPSPPLDGGYVVRIATALWFSPAGGLAAFWPLMILLLLMTGAAVWGAVRRHALHQLLATGLVALVIIFNTGLLVRFVAPFGWVAWGPRLMLIWALPALVVVIIANRRMALGWVRRFQRDAIVWYPLMGACVVVGVVANVSARYYIKWMEFFDPPVYWTDSELYFATISAKAWDLQGPLMIVLRDAPRPVLVGSAVFGLVLVALLFAAVIWDRRRLVGASGSAPTC
jgi:hypothetical protein